eukprot:GHVT01009571.1.p1 GENE.GHVT01009571.1~~GHVT01009571.1.p1  ORF type:complete len:341 (+),score=40.00 GHVT01009571.1:425-1447(+)
MSVAAGSGGGGDGGSGPSVNRVGPGPSWASSSSTSSSSMSAAPRKVQPASAASGAPTMQPAAASRLRLFLSTRRQQDCHICRDGGQVVLDQISGDQLCRNCGLILESKILSEEQEWRNFSGDSGVGSGDRSRVGEAVDTWLQDGIGGTTMLGGSKRLLQLNESTTSVGTNDRLLKSAFANLRLVAEALNLRDNVIETAKDIAKDLLDTGALKSRNTLLNMLAVVYLACREAGVHRSLKEMTVYDQCLTERELGKAVNTVKKLLPSRSTSNYHKHIANTIFLVTKKTNQSPHFGGTRRSTCSSCCNKKTTSSDRGVISRLVGLARLIAINRLITWDVSLGL